MLSVRPDPTVGSHGGYRFSPRLSHSGICKNHHAAHELLSHSSWIKDSNDTRRATPAAINMPMPPDGIAPLNPPSIGSSWKAGDPFRLTGSSPEPLPKSPRRRDFTVQEDFLIFFYFVHHIPSECLHFCIVIVCKTSADCFILVA